MASRDEIENLRALARKRHRAATQKVSRLRAKGVEVSGTKLDPRKAPDLFKRMNSIQLNAHISRLDKFTSRDTSFAKGAGRTTILDANLLKTQQRLQNALNRKNAKPFDNIKDIFLKTTGMTVAQSMGVTPQHPVTANPSARAPHIPVEKTAVNFPSNKALKKTIADLQKKLDASYTDKMVARDRKITAKFLQTIAKINKSKELKEIRLDYKNLTPGQFSFLWNYTPFSEVSSFDYEIAKSKLHDPKSLAQFDAAFDTQIRMMHKLMKEVKGLDL